MRKLGSLVLMVFVCLSAFGQEEVNMGSYQLKFTSAPGGTNYIQSASGSATTGIWTFKSRFDNLVFDAGVNTSNPRNLIFSIGGVEKARLFSNGCLGIGTPSPSSLFTLNKACSESGINTIQTFESNSVSYLKFGLFGNATSYDLKNTATLWSNNRNIALWAGNPGNSILFSTGTSATERMRINHDGNVGIGTITPASKLEVVAANAQLRLSRALDTNQALVLQGGGNYARFISVHDTDTKYRQHFAFIQRCSLGDREVVRIDADGNLGIGITTPDAKLEVAGNIKAQEIEVTLASIDNMQLNGTLAANQITVTTNGQTADFVFEEDYELRNLQEVETFIQTNKHLPDIPSAAAMEENGVNLAEMNKLLLQKIEELTLYSIDLEKRDQEMRDKLEEEREERRAMRGEIEELRKMVMELVNTPNP